MAIKLMVGLGNPGLEYEQTRHNAGMLYVDWWRQQLNGSAWSEVKKFKALMSKVRMADEETIILAQPQTYMNLSGEAVRAITDYYRLKADEVMVAFDDLDLKLGEWKIQKGKGPHGHNGLESIYTHLGTKDFWHLRLGIDDREGERVIAPRDYVLMKLSNDELEELKRVFGEIKIDSL